MSCGRTSRRKTSLRGSNLESFAAALDLIVVRGKRVRNPEMEIEDGEQSFPERRLWAAVVLQALEDYEDLLRQFESYWNKVQRPVQYQLWCEACAIRRHCQHELFQTICEHAGIDYGRVVRKIRQMERDYCFASIPHETSGTVYSEQWFERKRRLGRKVK